MHHACFSLQTGEALAASALNPADSYATVRDGDRVRITGRRTVTEHRRPPSPPSSVVIVGDEP